jgi:hypothetical protein
MPPDTQIEWQSKLMGESSVLRSISKSLLARGAGCRADSLAQVQSRNYFTATHDGPLLVIRHAGAARPGRLGMNGNVEPGCRVLMLDGVQMPKPAEDRV